MEGIFYSQWVSRGQFRESASWLRSLCTADFGEDNHFRRLKSWSNHGQATELEGGYVWCFLMIVVPWRHSSLTLPNLMYSLNDASRCFSPSCSVLVELRHLASLGFDNHRASLCNDPTCRLFLARGVILFHQVVSSHPSSAEGHLRLADFALEVPWNKFDVIMWSPVFRLSNQVHLPLSDPKSQKYVLFRRWICIFSIFLCQFDYRPLFNQLGSDSQADDAQEAYRLAVQAADDIILVRAACIVLSDLSESFRYLGVSQWKRLPYSSIVAYKLIHWSICHFPIKSQEDVDFRQWKWRPEMWQHSFLWAGQAWNWAGGTVC